MCMLRLHEEIHLSVFKNKTLTFIMKCSNVSKARMTTFNLELTGKFVEHVQDTGCQIMSKQKLPIIQN